MRIVLVAAVARNGVIGNGPDIPWRIPGEQGEFKKLTMGHTLLMGRTTYESIGRPLPGADAEYDAKMLAAYPPRSLPPARR